MASTFQAGGLASGLDTNTIIDKLVELRSGKVTQLKTKQSAFQSQVSVVADLTSKLAALKTAAEALKKGGALGTKVQSTPVGYGVTTTSEAQAGRYQIEVGTLAKAAKARSTGFASAGSPVSGGSLGISINGEAFNVNIADGSSLNEVAAAINSQVGKVSATVLSNGTQSFLSITNRDTGFTVGGNANDALVITENTTGSAGQPLGFAVTQTASNAKLKVDGLEFERTSNTVADVLPGVTFSLTAPGAEQELVLDNDLEATKHNLGGFVDAYNSVLKAIQKQLAVQPLTDRQYTLSGDGTLKSLQSTLQGFVTRQVGGTDVRALADIGLKSDRTGQLSIDDATLSKAMARSPAAINSLFTNATDGLGAAASKLVDGYTNSVDGVLTVRTTSLNKSVKRLDTDISNAQRSIDLYRETLVSQYTAMESIVSKLKSVGNYLTSQEAANNKS